MTNSAVKVFEYSVSVVDKICGRAFTVFTESPIVILRWTARYDLSVCRYFARIKKLLLSVRRCVGHKAAVISTTKTKIIMLHFNYSHCYNC